jgi:rare lipoprotein A (peptidoglycan hydrolase)
MALAMACAHPAVRTEAPPERETLPPQPERRVQTGVASYYVDEFEARLTACGVPYRSSQMTCSHRTLPFGTVVTMDIVQ